MSFTPPIVLTSDLPSAPNRQLIALLTFVLLLLATGCTPQSPLAVAEVNEACQSSPEKASTVRVLASNENNAFEATQWHVHQLNLNAAETVANPYTDVTVSATFNGPNGEALTVQGFWNGDSTFAVRFTPTAAGEWSYSINSTPADAGLTQTGTLQVAAAEERGFVRRDPANPYSFVYDNGDRYFMMGNTYYDLIRTACAGDRWQEGIVKSGEYGINKIRIFVHSLGFGQDHWHPDYHPAAFPFVEDDHDQIDVDYWRKMDEVVSYLAEQGMVADLILFMRPYNIEDELAFGTQEQDERYVRYILARYAAFPNVIWCLTNEWEYTGKDEAYWEGMGELVRTEDPWMTLQSTAGEAHRALSIHNATNGRSGGLFSYFDDAWPVYATVQYGVRNARFANGDEWANYSIVQNHGNNMPVVNDEYGYIGEVEPVELTREQHRRALWAITVGGGYGSVGDSRIFNDGPNDGYAQVIMTGHWHDAVEYEDIQRVVDFWTQGEIPYWRMEPQNERVVAGQNVYLLAEGDLTQDGAQIVIQAAAGGELTLAVPDGRYTVTRFDPRTGESTLLPEVAGESLSLALPDTQDWVLHLIRQGS